MFFTGTTRIRRILDRYRKDIENLSRGIDEVDAKDAKKAEEARKIEEERQELATVRSVAIKARTGLENMLDNAFSEE